MKKNMKADIDEKIRKISPTYEEWERYFTYVQKKTTNFHFHDNCSYPTYRKSFEVVATNKTLENFLRWVQQQRKK